MVQAVSAIEALRAALAEGWRAEVVSDGDVRVYQPGGQSWLFIRTDKSDADKLVHGLATVFAAACNVAPELLAELDKAQRSADHWHECFTVLEKAIVGDTAASAIDEAKRLRAEVDRQREVIRRVNARCDHLGMSLRDIKAERDALRAELAELIEGAESMLGTCGVVWGETPEDSDTHTHDDWAEKFLSERLDAARAALKERT
jgi:hypothetical protein